MLTTPVGFSAIILVRRKRRVIDTLPLSKKEDNIMQTKVTYLGGPTYWKLVPFASSPTRGLIQRGQRRMKGQATSYAR